MTTQYLVLVTLPSGRVSQVWSTGTVDASDPDDRPADAAVRAALRGRVAGCTATVAHDAGKMVYRKVGAEAVAVCRICRSSAPHGPQSGHIYLA